MDQKHIAIVGAGPGGLCAGMLLSAKGFKVSLYDKNAEVGGRNRALREQGYHFDVGPTFLLMKHILDEMFELCGRNSQDYLEFIKLDPMYRLYFNDKSLYVYSDPERMREELRANFAEGSQGFDRYLAKEGKRFEHLYPCITRDYSSLSAFFSKDLIKALGYLGLNHSVFSNLGRYFQDEKLRLVFSFQSKYLGMSPWECPAMFTMLSYLEHAFGLYHVKGGLSRISTAMAKVIEEQGGTIHSGQSVQEILIHNGKASGLRLADGSQVQADEVVLNADFAYAMSNLVRPDTLRKYSPERLKRLKYSCSTFMLYLGLDKLFDIPHHNIVFADDYRTNIADIFVNKTLSEEFSFYVQNASIHDPSLAPDGHSALYILVPVANQESGVDWAAQMSSWRDKVLDAVQERLGLTGLREHIVCERCITPADWENRENVYLGATFNLAHQFSQMLYWRPHNRFEEFDNCYLVGGGTHPGSGLPTIYESARISSRLICRKYGLAE